MRLLQTRVEYELEAGFRSGDFIRLNSQEGG